MKNSLVPSTIAALLVGATSAFAQLSPLPPSSSLDGVTPQPIGLNAGPTHWDATPGIASYKISGDGNQPNPGPGNPDSVLGLNWGAAAPSLSAVNTEGGLIRTIFVGETAGWVNDFGYTYSGQPEGAGSYTVWSDIQTNGMNASGIAFGDFFDVRFDAGEVGDFDLWLNGSASTTPGFNPNGSNNGGYYTLFDQSNSSRVISPGNVKWAQSSLSVNTFVGFDSGGNAVYKNFDTWLVSIEDWRLDRNADRDYTDLVLAVQVLSTTDLQFGAVPEPSTYGLMGMALLVGVVGFRRWKGCRKGATSTPTA